MRPYLSHLTAEAGSQDPAFTFLGPNFSMTQKEEISPANSVGPCNGSPGRDEITSTKTKRLAGKASKALKMRA